VRLLGFGPTLGDRAAAQNGKRLRRACFEARSSLPISAACVVANCARETLSSLLGAPIALRLFEPSIPPPQAWPAILQQARLYRVRGNVADAAIVLRSDDAVALAAALFGEPQAGATAPRALSPIECELLDRLVGALAANLGAICGTRDGHSVERVAGIGGFETYFELVVDEPVAARIGIALSRDPSPEPRGRVEAAHLGAIKLVTRARLEVGTMQAAAVARLAVGAVIPVSSAELHRCVLTAHGRQLARGSCGVRSGRYALNIEPTREVI
jgi:hypothetical protein